MDTLTNGEKFKDLKFPKFYTKIVYLANSIIDWDTSESLVFRLYNDNNIHSSSTFRLNYWFEITQDRFQYLFYQCDKIIVPNNEFKKLFPEDLHKIIHCYNEEILLPKNIRQYFISDKIIHIEDQFKNYLEIKQLNYKNNEPCYFFGLYDEIDYNRLVNHCGKKYLIFGGSDLDMNMYHTKVLIPKLKDYLKNNNVKIYFISDNLYKRGRNLGLNGHLIKLDLLNNKWDSKREDISNIRKRKNIYCYSGYGNVGKLYNYDLLKKVEGRLPEYNFIYSHTLKLPFDEMLKVYNKCFMGVRLTKKDGNANTVIEMGKLGIPVIFNGNNYNAINYINGDVDDIVNKILSMSS